MKIQFYNSIDVHNHVPVVPAKTLVPEWYKQVQQNTSLHPGGPTIPTIKQCPPVTDMLTSGYIISCPVDVTLYPKEEPANYKGINAQTHPDYMPSQHHWKMCPVDIKGKEHWTKLKHGWTVRTPEGYSCLLMQPFYFFNKDITLFPAVVDTDKHDIPVEFPGYLHSNNKTIIKQGTPLMQVIPFKRDEWQMEMLENTGKPSILEQGSYKDLVQSKKKFQ